MKRYVLGIITAFIIAAMPIFLSSCGGLGEPASLTHILAIGIDRGEGGNYNFTFLFSQEGQGEDYTPKSNALISVAAPSLGQAESTANFYSNRRMGFTHVYIILFSTDVAKDSLEPLITSIANYDKIRPLTAIGVTDGLAADYLKGFDDTVIQSLPDFLGTFVTDSSRVYAPLESLYRIYPQFDSDLSALALPLFLNDDRSEGPPPQPDFPQNAAAVLASVADGEAEDEKGKKNVLESPLDFGMVIIRDFRQIASCGGAEAFIYNAVSGRLPYIYTSIDMITGDKDYSMFIKRRSDPKINISIEKNYPQINIALEFDHKTITKIDAAPQRIDEIADNAEVILEKAIEAFLYKTSREWGCDIFSFYDRITPKFLTLAELYGYDWGLAYKNAVFNVEVDITSSTITNPQQVLPKRQEE